MKDSDNDFTLLPTDPSSPIDTGHQTGAPENKHLGKTRKWHGPALVLITCVIVGITFSQWQRLVITLLAGDYQNARPVFIFAFIGLGLTVALSVMTAILIRRNGLVFLISIIYAVLPYAASPQSDLKLYFIAASGLLITSASFSIRSEAELLIKPSIQRFFKSGASRYFTAASLAVAFCVGVSFNSSVATTEKLVPVKFFNFYIAELHRYLPQSFTLPSGIIGDEDSVDAKRGIVISLPQANETIDVYLDSVAREMLVQTQPEVMAIGEADINATVEAMRNELSEQTGIKLTGQEQALFVLYKIFVIKADALMATYREVLPIVAGVAAFALMRAISLIAYIPALILTAILMAIGQALKLWGLEKETVTLERFRI